MALDIVSAHCIHRIGRLLISDWLTEDGDSYPPTMAEFLASGNHPWFPIGLYRLGGLVEGLGFKEIALEDRHDWYRWLSK